MKWSLLVGLAGLVTCLVALGGVWALYCRPTAAPDDPTEPAWFEDVTEQVGIHFIHDPGPVGTYFMPQEVGSGGAFFDFDGDGLLDIYLLQNGGPNGPRNVLYKQTADHHFVDVSAGSGLDIAGYNMGVAIGDVNNDGFPDVLVTQYIGVKLFLNNGNGTFTDATAESGLSNPAWAMSAAFLDYDRDGRLDLVVVNYVDYDPTHVCTGPTKARDFCAPKSFKGRVSRLFHNLGGRAAAPGQTPSVKFEDATESSGLGRVPGPGLGVICADFDGDGWPDIFIANDEEPNRLWINKRDGTFREEAVQRGIARNSMGRAQAGMGVAIGDVSETGFFDVFVTHLAEETHTLWKQGPRGLFLDKTAESGIAGPTSRGTGFGTALADFDNNGTLDLAIVNGHISNRPEAKLDPDLGPFWSAYADHNQVFRGLGGGKFEDRSRSDAPFCRRPTVSRGLARGDFDGDGGQDLLVTSIGAPARLYRNVAPSRGHWLTVRAFDPVLHRDAYGAEVRVKAGSRTRTAWLNAAESYLCSCDPRAHFGLGAVTHVDGIEVVWPDGARETFPGGDVDRAVRLDKGGGRSASP